MRIQRLLILAFGVFVFLVLLSGRETTRAYNVQTIVTHPQGGDEVPPRDTNAQGNALFVIEEDGVSYKLIVANIQNVIAAHIHLGAAGVNGPVVAFLYDNHPPGGGRIQGVIGEGTITASDLLGPLAGQPLSALLEAIEEGNIYVNVHTNDGVGSTNTGPGDFPGGEIRGQL
jgi:hypothetical protein